MDSISQESEVDLLTVQTMLHTDVEEKDPLSEVEMSSELPIIQIKSEYSSPSSDGCMTKLHENAVLFSFVKREAEDGNSLNYNIPWIETQFMNSSTNVISEVKVEKILPPHTFSLLKSESVEESNNRMTVKEELKEEERSKTNEVPSERLKSSDNNILGKEVTLSKRVTTKHTLEDSISSGACVYRNVESKDFRESSGDDLRIEVKISKKEIISVDSDSRIKTLSKSNADALKCALCGKCYAHTGSLRRHLRIHSGMKPFKCDTCDKCFSNSGDLKGHSRVHSREKPFKCQLCEKSFALSGNLKHHTSRVHVGIKPYKCNLCAKCFFTARDLREHLRSHSGLKPFKCEQCDRCFSSSGHLKSHIRIHTGEKPLECDLCGRFFAGRETLRRHLRIHTGEKPFKCDICGKAFSLLGNLKCHLQIHTGKKPLECHTCGKCFSFSGNLKRHLRMHSLK